MLKLFAAFKKEFGALMLYICVLSAVSGNAAGMVVAILNRAARQAVSGRLNWQALLAFCLALTVFLLAKREALRKSVYFAERAVELYRLRLIVLLGEAELLDIEQLDQADICVRLTEDAARISQALRRSVRVLQSGVTVLFFLLYITWLYHGATFFLLAFGGLGLVLYLIVADMLNTANHAILERETAVFELVNEMWDGFKELTMARQKHDDLYQHDLLPRIEHTTLTRIHFKNLLSDIRTTAHVLHYIALGSIIFLFPPDVSMAVRFQAAAVTLVLARHFRRFYLEFPIITRAGVALERLQGLEQRLSAISTERRSVECVPSQYLQDFEEFAVEHLRFDHCDAAGNILATVGPLNFMIRAGEIVVITGGNGSGKTTFLKAMLGLYAAQTGIYTINREPVRIAEHRMIFAAIFADTHVFQGLYGIDSLDPQRVQKLLTRMELSPKIRWRKGRFTHLDLSAGQRKRLALVVALLEQKPVYVFDEWAVEQDPSFRAYFYEEVLPELKSNGKAVIVVTQDQHYFSSGDRVLKMQDGRFAEGWTWQP